MAPTSLGVVSRGKQKCPRYKATIDEHLISVKKSCLFSFPDVDTDGVGDTDGDTDGVGDTDGDGDNDSDGDGDRC